MTYDPTIGRWISEDPIGFTAADENLYRYVSNSPTNAVDPTGLQLRSPFDPIGGTRPSSIFGNSFRWNGANMNLIGSNFQTGFLGRDELFIHANGRWGAGGLFSGIPGILIGLKGPRANKVTFLQFKKFTVQYEVGGVRSDYTGSFVAHGENHPIGGGWMIDTLQTNSAAYGTNAAPHPTGYDARANLTWMIDIPSSPILAFEAAHKDLVTRQGKRVDEMLVQAHFTTYLVVDGQPIGWVLWGSQIQWKRGESTDRGTLNDKLYVWLSCYGNFIRTGSLSGMTLADIGSRGYNPAGLPVETYQDHVLELFHSPFKDKVLEDAMVALP